MGPGVVTAGGSSAQVCVARCGRCRGVPALAPFPSRCAIGGPRLAAVLPVGSPRLITSTFPLTPSRVAPLIHIVPLVCALIAGASTVTLVAGRVHSRSVFLR